MPPVVDKIASFGFRQRAGRLNWKQISSLETEEIINNLRVNDLQIILDTVTFSEILPIDIKNNTIDNVAKLINLMQLTVEYLLFHQESQFQSIRKLNSKVGTLKAQRESIMQENVAYQEDIKTYKRQLHILRKALNGGRDVTKHGPRIIYPSSDHNNSDNSQKLLKVMMEHEYESRRLLSSLIEDQRRAFSQEMLLLLDSFRAMKGGENTSGNINILLENMKLQFDQSLRVAMAGIEDKFNRPKSPPRERKPDKSTEDILKQAALENYEKELIARERMLKEREDSLRRREEALRNMELEKINNANVNERNKLFARNAFAAKTLIYVLKIGARKRKYQFFRKWMDVVNDARMQELSDEHGRHLLYVNERKSVREVELEHQYEAEKERHHMTQNRLTSVQRELENLRDQYSDLFKNQRDLDLDNQLKLEKEKLLILQARYNTLFQKYEREKAEWLQKPGSPVRKPSQDTAVATSLEFLPPKKISQDISVGQSFQAPARVLTEDELLEEAMARISSRNSKETIEQLAVATLTQEFLTKLVN